jgi:hypothetical protein
MNRNRYGIAALTALAVALAWVAAGPAEANICPDNAGTKFIVDQVADLPFVTSGYTNNACNIEIRTSFTPAVNALNINALTIKVIGPDALNPGQPVTINNPNPGTTIRLNSLAGFQISEADIRATNQVRIGCIQAGCTGEVDLSTIISSSTLAFGAPGGRVDFDTDGLLDIQTSTVYGGNNLTLFSDNGSIIFLCVPGQGGCKDPTLQPFPQIVLDKCGNPPVFPCTLDNLSQAELKAVCIQAPGVQCGGAQIELHIQAKFDVDITGSKIDGKGSFRITTDQGRLFASGAELNAQNLNLLIAGNGLEPAIDLTDAILTVESNIRISTTGSSGCPAPPAICIDATGAVMNAKEIRITANGGNGVVRVCDARLVDDGNDFAVVNGDNNPNNPDYSPNVVDSAAECAPDGPVQHN